MALLLKPASPTWVFMLWWIEISIFNWTYNTGTIDGRTGCLGSAYCSACARLVGRPAWNQSACWDCCCLFDCALLRDSNCMPTPDSDCDCVWLWLRTVSMVLVLWLRTVWYSSCCLLVLLLAEAFTGWDCCTSLCMSSCELLWALVRYCEFVVSYSEPLRAIVNSFLLWGGEYQVPVAYYIGGCLVYCWPSSFISMVCCRVYKL